MKKLLVTLCIIAMASVIMAQKVPFSASDGSSLPASRDNEFVCPPGSVFSQVAPTHDNAFFCQLGYFYYIATDDYIASGPFSTMRFWGGDYWGCSLAPTEMFDVFIYNGNPASGGNLIYSSTLAGITTPIGVISFGGTPLYQIDINFGTTITQLNGWIAITRTGATCSSGFAWASFGQDTGNAMSYYTYWEPNYGNLFFCLGGGEVVPVSNWALFIGLGLILVFTIVRFRKLV